MSTSNTLATEGTVQKLLSGEVLPDRLGNVATIYSQLIDLLERTASQLEFNPYEPYLRILLKSFNPRYQFRFWRSISTRGYLSRLDAFWQELPFSESFLHALEAYTPQQLNALHQCNRINLRRLSNRILLSNANKILVGMSAIIGLFAGLKQVSGIEISALLSPFASELLWAAAPGVAVGLVVSIMSGYLLLWHKLSLLRAFEDLLSIALAYSKGHE